MAVIEQLYPKDFMAALGNIANRFDVLQPNPSPERIDQPRVNGVVCLWKNVQDPEIEEKKWSVILIHQPNGTFLTSAQNEFAHEALPAAPADLLKLYADAIKSNMQLTQAKKVDIIRENYFPYIIINQNIRTILFQPKYRILQCEEGAAFTHNFIINGSEVWDQIVGLKEDEVDKRLYVFPKMHRLQKPNIEMPDDEWDTSIKKIHTIGNQLLVKYDCIDGTKAGVKIAQGVIRHKWETIDGITPMIVQTQPIRGNECDFNLTFYSQENKYFKNTRMDFELMTNSISDREKLQICQQYIPDYENETFNETTFESCLDPEKLVSWNRWAVTLVDCGYALGSGSLNSINPVRIGHAMLIIEGVDYEGNHHVYKTHAWNNDGKLTPEWLDWPDFDPDRINGKSDTYLISFVGPQALKDCILKVMAGEIEISEEFDTIGYIDGKAPPKLADYSATNCTTWALRVLNSLGITLPQTSFEERNPLGNLLSGFTTGVNIDVRAYSQPTRSLISPDLYTRPKSPSVINQVLSYGTYGIGYVAGAVPSTALQLDREHREKTGISFFQLISMALNPLRS